MTEKPKIKTCQICGAEILPKGNQTRNTLSFLNKKFCSNACRLKSRSYNRPYRTDGDGKGRLL